MTKNVVSLNIWLEKLVLHIANMFGKGETMRGEPGKKGSLRCKFQRMALSKRLKKIHMHYD